MPATLTKQQAVYYYQRYLHDPVAFATEVLGVKLYDKEEELLRSVAGTRRLSCVGANSTGKDFTIGRVVIPWWHTTHYPAKTLVIAPHWRQVNSIIWKEFRLATQNSRIQFGGRMYETPRWEKDDENFALGFATDTPFTIQGFHSSNLMVILTEAHALPQEHVNSVMRLNPTLLIMTGNPLTSTGEFYDSHHSKRDSWATFQISGEDSPNVKEGKIIIPGLVTREDIEEKERDWGRESALFIAAVLGRFPESLDDVIVPLNLLMEATKREPIAIGSATLGCDIARSGNDSTIIYRAQGNSAKMVWRRKGADTQEVAGRIKAIAEDDKVVVSVVVDVVGVGAGVYDRLREAGFYRGGTRANIRLTAFNGGGLAQRKDRYVNAVSEAWVELGRRFREAEMQIDNNQPLLAQLSSRKYTIEGDRRIRLEPKEQYKKRTGRSPDEADALAMAFSPLMYPAMEHPLSGSYSKELGLLERLG